MNVVDILYILDRSGSMTNLMDDAIGGFNEFIKQQQKLPGEAYVTLVAFDDQYDVVFSRTPLADTPTLTRDMVSPRGSTALRDAVGKAVSSIPETWRIIVLIQTDGQENASKEWTQAALKDLISARQASGWEFQFVGVGIDAFAQGSAMGLSTSSISSVAASSAGIRSYTENFGLSAKRFRGA